LERRHTVVTVLICWIKKTSFHCTLWFFSIVLLCIHHNCLTRASSPARVCLFDWRKKTRMVYFNFNRIKTKKTLIGFGLGQILSLLSTSLSFTSSEIARKDFSFFFFSNHPIFKHSHELTKFEIFIGINAPTSQSFLGYVLLAIVYGGIMLYRRSAIKVSIEFLSLKTLKWSLEFLCSMRMSIEGFISNFLTNAKHL